MRGVLVVDKPAGLTSHDVVSIVRRLANTRRVGHTGTLDPMATGVLVLLVGAATRLARFAGAGRKRYRTVIRLGETTTTYDAEGEIVDRRSVEVDIQEIQDALGDFQGDIEQVPPMYAAIKVKGKKLYELAREGKVVKREPRPVTIHKLEILDWHSPDLTLDIVCSSGTYVRSLAHDLGQSLGCGGHVTELRRTENGSFTVEDAYTVDKLRTLSSQKALDSAFLPPYAALRGMPLAVVGAPEAAAIRHGQRVSLETRPTADEGDWVQARDGDGHLVAVLLTVEAGLFQPKVVFLPPSE